MLSALMLTAGAMTSCDKNDDEPSTSDPQISVTPDTATYATGETTEVKFAVTSNTKWDVKSDVAGVSFSPASGNGNATVTATVSPEVTAAIINVTFTAYGKLGDITLTEPCNVTITAGDLEGTLATINEPGDYSVEDVWVVQNTTDSFVITDRTGAYMYVYLGSGKGTEYTPGTGLNVSGKVEERNSFLQFGTATTVTKNGNTHEVVLPEPEVLAGKAFENVPAKKFSYIQFTGKLVKNNNYNNVVVEGSSRQGSPLYLFSSYGDVVVADCYDTTVTITGFVTGLPGGYVQVVVTAIEPDTTTPILKVNPTALTFAATDSTNDIQTVSISWKYTGSDTSSAEITEGSEYFGFRKFAPYSVQVWAKSANDGEERTGVLTITSGETSVQVPLTQYAAGIAAKTVTFDFVGMGLAGSEASVKLTPDGGLSSDKLALLSKDGVSITFGSLKNSNVPQFYTNGNAVRFYANNTINLSSSKNILEVQFAFTSDYNTGSDNAKNLSFIPNAGTWSDATSSWKGSTTDLTMSLGTESNTSGQVRFTTVTVTYQE